MGLGCHSLLRVAAAQVLLQPSSRLSRTKHLGDTLHAAAAAACQVWEISEGVPSLIPVHQWDPGPGTGALHRRCP